jgi:hypothetical protein
VFGVYLAPFAGVVIFFKGSFLALSINSVEAIYAGFFYTLETGFGNIADFCYVFSYVFFKTVDLLLLKFVVEGTFLTA